MLTFIWTCSIVCIVPVRNKNNKRDSGSAGRVRPCQGRGRGFEPRLSLLEEVLRFHLSTFFVIQIEKLTLVFIDDITEYSMLYIKQRTKKLFLATSIRGKENKWKDGRSQLGL